LVFPDFSSRFYLECDGSKYGYGGILYHLSDDLKRRVIQYASSLPPKSQRLFSGAQLEAAAAAWAMNHFRSF
jgi:hypothetical protein